MRTTALRPGSAFRPWLGSKRSQKRSPAVWRDRSVRAPSVPIRVKRSARGCSSAWRSRFDAARRSQRRTTKPRPARRSSFSRREYNRATLHLPWTLDRSRSPFHCSFCSSGSRLGSTGVGDVGYAPKRAREERLRNRRSPSRRTVSPMPSRASAAGSVNKSWPSRS